MNITREHTTIKFTDEEIATLKEAKYIVEDLYSRLSEDENSDFTYKYDVYLADTQADLDALINHVLYNHNKLEI